jgi:outer membrane protein TolC
VSNHEPREAFVAQLEERLLADLHRQRLAAPAPRWLPRTTRGLAFATAIVVLISMAIGGGVVSAAYEAQDAAQRDALVATYQQRHDLAVKQLALARQKLAELERQISVGMGRPIDLPETQLAVTQAEVELQLVQIDVAEVTATGREPVKTVSAPVVGGRDFVTERWQVESQVPAVALQLARTALAAAQTRLDVGLANNNDVDAASARLIELESAVQVGQQKLALRRAYLKKELTPAVADLRVMEAETEMRRTALTRRIEFARRQLRDLQLRVEIGTMSPIDLAQANVQLQELQLALTKADYDLALIRKQLGK